MTEPEPGQPGAHAITLARNGELAGQWKLDPQASLVEFRVRHFWHAITVRGSFAEVSGQGTVDPDGTASGTLVIAAASLTTNNKQRDKHLRSADFFDAATLQRDSGGAAGDPAAERAVDRRGHARSSRHHRARHLHRRDHRSQPGRRHAAGQPDHRPQPVRHDLEPPANGREGRHRAQSPPASPASPPTARNSSSHPQQRPSGSTGFSREVVRSLSVSETSETV